MSDRLKFLDDRSTGNTSEASRWNEAEDYDDTPYFEAISDAERDRIRAAIEYPDYTYDSSVNPLHDRIWTDDQVIILSPVWKIADSQKNAPSLKEIDRVLSTHSARAVRPGIKSPTMSCYDSAVETIARYCRLHGRLHNAPSWTSLAIQLSEKHKIQPLLTQFAKEDQKNQQIGNSVSA